LQSLMATTKTKAKPEEIGTVHSVIVGKKLWDYQDDLRSLPLPDLDKSVHAFYTALRPLCSDAAELELLTSARDEMLKDGSDGRRLHALLEERAARCSQQQYPNGSWLEQWWDHFAYLSDRSSLAINVNFFGTCFSNQVVGERTAVAAALIDATVFLKHMIDTGELAPDSLDRNGLVPLCSYQYTRLFSTTRVPGVQVDRFESYARSAHVGVHLRGQWFALRVLAYTDGDGDGGDGAQWRAMSADQIHDALQWIDARSAHVEARLSSSGDDAERDRCRAATLPVAALTSERRDVWARARDSIVECGDGDALHLVESAILHVSMSKQRPRTFAETMVACEIGDIERGSYWFDKSSTLFVFANGRVGFGGEHGCADAPVPARAIQSIARRALQDGHIGRLEAKQKERRGRSVADANAFVTAIEWRNSARSGALVVSVADAQRRLRSAAAASDLAALRCTTVTRAVFKELKLSPDSTFQMAMQLAYFRDQRCFTSTYETGTTRAYYHGRTETIRPLSSESVAWVRAMEDERAPSAERAQLLRCALKVHAGYMKAACFGKAPDRHMMGLRLAALEHGGIAPPRFLVNEIVERAGRFGLSTSNMTTRSVDLPGFGAPYPFSYGVCYNLDPAGAMATVTSDRSEPSKNCARFVEHIDRALHDIIDLMRSAASSEATSSSKAKL
jgi:carnitine O-acetyltransferase